MTAVAIAFQTKGLIRRPLGVVDILDQPGPEAISRDYYGTSGRLYERLFAGPKAA